MLHVCKHHVNTGPEAVDAENRRRWAVARLDAGLWRD
jgi:hypothetical protein